MIALSGGGINSLAPLKILGLFTSQRLSNSQTASVENASHREATIKSNTINIKEGLLKVEKHTNNCLLVKGFRVLN